MLEKSSPTRLTIIVFFLIVWTNLFYSVSLADPAKILIRNASLLMTMDPSIGEGVMGMMKDADLLVENDKIAAVGQKMQDTGAEVLDASGMIVMPGFIDTHNHLWQSLLRGCGTDQDLLGWFDTCVVMMRFCFSGFPDYIPLALS